MSKNCLQGGGGKNGGEDVKTGGNAMVVGGINALVVAVEIADGANWNVCVFASNHWSMKELALCSCNCNVIKYILFSNRLDKHRINQNIIDDRHAEISGTRSRSNIYS